MDANLKYIYFLNLAYPLDCLHVPQGVRVPPVENHCVTLYIYIYIVMNSVYWPQWVRPANGLIMTGCRWVRHLLPVKVV